MLMTNKIKWYQFCQGKGFTEFYRYYVLSNDKFYDLKLIKSDSRELPQRMIMNKVCIFLWTIGRYWNQNWMVIDSLYAS